MLNHTTTLARLLTLQRAIHVLEQEFETLEEDSRNSMNQWSLDERRQHSHIMDCLRHIRPLRIEVDQAVEIETLLYNKVEKGGFRATPKRLA